MKLAYPERTQTEAQAWIARLASGDLSPVEWSRLHDWLARGDAEKTAFETARSLWQDVATIEANFGPSDEASQRRSQKAFAKPHVWRWGGAAAACLLLAALSPQAWLMMQTDLAAPATAARVTELPDGSRVALDAGSRIAVDFDGRQRAITLLEGRAWFEVRHGDARPFTVAAKGGVTEDVGTAFEVDATLTDVEVHVSAGQVRVQTRSAGKWRPLAAGQGVRYGKDVISPLPDTPPADVAAWRDGDVILRDAPVAEAVRELSRYRGSPVWLMTDASSLAPVSGNFRAGQPEAALEMVAQMRALKITRLPGGIWVVTK